MMSTSNTTQSRSAENNIRTLFIGSTILSIQGCTIILVNLLTIITFTINRHLRKRSMYCVINQAVADMLFGIGELLNLFLRTQTSVSHLWRAVIITFKGAGTLFSLALVAAERMCATVWPVRHRNARPWAYTLAISMTWVAACVIPVLLAIVLSTVPDSTSFLFLFPGSVMAVVVGVICVSYLMIFIKVKQQKQQMAGQRVSGPDQRLAMTLFIVTMASFGTWTPLALIAILSATEIVYSLDVVSRAAIILAFCNSLMNPIIYVFRMKDFRKALLRLLLKCSRDRPTQAVPLSQTNNRQNR